MTELTSSQRVSTFVTVSADLAAEGVKRQDGGRIVNTGPGSDASWGAYASTRVVFGVSPNRVFRRDAGKCTRDACVPQIGLNSHKQRLA